MRYFLTIVLKFIYSQKANTFCEIFTLILSNVVLVQSKVKISQNLVAFSEYMNFNREEKIRCAMDRMRMAGREKVHYEHATKNPWISRFMEMKPSLQFKLK